MDAGRHHHRGRNRSWPADAGLGRLPLRGAGLPARCGGGCISSEPLAGLCHGGARRAVLGLSLHPAALHALHQGNSRRDDVRHAHHRRTGARSFHRAPEKPRTRRARARAPHSRAAGADQQDRARTGTRERTQRRAAPDRRALQRPFRDLPARQRHASPAGACPYGKFL